jgi:hypothetical protein
MRTTEFVCESSELMVLRGLYDQLRCVPGHDPSAGAAMLIDLAVISQDVVDSAEG